MLSLFTSCSLSPLEPPTPRNPLPRLEELDSWLAAREAAVPGLRPGVEAGVVWANPVHPAKTRYSIVYLPGYTATRGEISPVAERVAQAWGANLYFSRPTGQGSTPEAHRTVTASDWVADGLEAWNIGRLLGDEVILVGVSTGATLATYLTLGPAQLRPAASVLVSPNLTPFNRQTELLLWPGREWLLKALLGDMMTTVASNEEVARFWDSVHHSHSLIPMMELVAGARSRDFSRWPTPVLVVYDREDRVVDERVTVKLFSRVPSTLSELVAWTAAPGDDHHVLAGHALSPGGTEPMVATILDFLKRRLR